MLAFTHYRKRVSFFDSVQRAIDYVEANICEQIDYEEVAKTAYSSSFHFQRVFGILCGYSLGDYIRMRRLSLAGEELSAGNAKIIDVALKYGYDTPESFSRAFTRFHGISPSDAKRGGNIRLFTPLSVKLILSGGCKMDYSLNPIHTFTSFLQTNYIKPPKKNLDF